MLNRPRAIRVLLNVKTCIFCQSQQQLPLIHQNGLFTSSSLSNPRAKASIFYAQAQNYATQTLDVQRLRADIDQRARIGFFTLTNHQNVLHIEANKAHSIIEDFLHRKSKLDHGSNIRRLSKKYHISADDLASLAIVTFNIPDLSDPEKRAMLPPSQHKHISGLLLQGCAQVEDPLAIIQIMSAVYLSTSTAERSIREIAGLFPRSEIARYRIILEKLGADANSFALGPHALTLQGFLLEREGQKQKAKELYQKATLLSHTKYNPKSKHPMLLGLVEPWNALGFLLKADPTPEAQVEAKSYFEKGALEGDDPLSYFELAAFEQKSSIKWLQYTSKAAASGYTPAIIDMAEFYYEVNSKNPPLLKNGNLRKALMWLLDWKRNSANMLAREWLQVATNAGHKPSMLKLADYYESKGDHELAKEQLRQILKPPSPTNQHEEWPQLVRLAKRRLAATKT